MRDLFHSFGRRRLTAVAITALLAGGASAGQAMAAGSRDAARGHHHQSAAQQRAHRRAQQRKAREKARQRALLDLKSRLKRAQAVGALVPMTIRLRKPFEAGPGDDRIEFAFDTSAVPWPLAGTVPPAAPGDSDLDGSVSYAWDFSADTTGYATLGTIETLVGSNVSLTGTGFQLAAADSPCTTAQSLDITAMSFTSAGLRFGLVNPFSNTVSGTIALRTNVRTKLTPCGGATISPDNAAVAAATTDPPLPVAFDGTFTVSPSVESDGHLRLGELKISDATTPQRTTFGLIHACTDPTAADGCAEKAFPVRTKIVSLNADVLLGDQMPGPPPAP